MFFLSHFRTLLRSSSRIQIRIDRLRFFFFISSGKGGGLVGMTCNQSTSFSQGGNVQFERPASEKIVGWKNLSRVE